jgi:hypothetical protein
MKTYTRYEDVPKGAQYLGSENNDGTMPESLADAIADALAPVQLIDSFGVAYFEVAQ